MARTKKDTTESAVLEADVIEEGTGQIDTLPDAPEGDSAAESAPDKLTITQEELDAKIASAVAAALADVKPQIVQVAPMEDPVVLLFLGGIMSGSTVALGELGNIYRDGGTLTVSRENFFSKLNGTAELMLRRRKLIVVSGLSDDERERYGVLYGENELLTERTYGRLLSYPENELKTVYTGLCPEHKALVAKVFRSGIEQQDGRVTERKLKMLAKIDRGSGMKDSPFLTMLSTFTSAEEDEDD